MQRRALSDIAITRTGKPILRVQGGRFVASSPGPSFSDSVSAALPSVVIP
jgi:hypothetical protein